MPKARSASMANGVPAGTPFAMDEGTPEVRKAGLPLELRSKKRLAVLKK
ncbi:MAG: hypothetical protein IJ191_06455 [Treponema sp.]|nr:hypothetical protein [Treponema sp.]